MNQATLEQVLALRSAEDVAALLGIDYGLLKYHLYVSKRETRYTRFTIPKRSGGVREISAPATALKMIQRQLATVLVQAFKPGRPVQGFALDRNIVSNAGFHVRKQHVLNVDLQDFFPSINFGRVRGMFLAAPYGLPNEVATILAQICCAENQLPQGAPTSPVISNMLCAKMDSELRRLAQAHRCTYSRYADDMTFSTYATKFPSGLAVLNDSGLLVLGEELERVIGLNGFAVNPAKLRLQNRGHRQVVTGLTVNRFANVQRRYVRRLRAMLYAWRKFGLEAAEQEFLDRYDKPHRGPYKSRPSFKHVVRGRIEFLGMVRGKDDSIYRRFLLDYASLDPEYISPELSAPESFSLLAVCVWTEGKTDALHLSNALSRLQEQGLFAGLAIEYPGLSREQEGGDRDRLNMCTYYARSAQPNRTVFMFDRDNREIFPRVADPEQLFRDWGNNVFSFLLPVPEHRADADPLCIELYYSDEDIKRTDANGRRLFLNSEFHRESGRQIDGVLNCNSPALRQAGVRVIDDRVFDGSNRNVALPKSDFAENILNRVTGFDDVDVSRFSEIFTVLAEIANRGS